MTRIRRRELFPLMAAGAAAQSVGQKSDSAAGLDPRIVTRHDENVDRVLAAQITDKSSRGYGSIPNAAGLFHAGAAGGIIDACMAGYLHPQSRFHGNNLLVDRIRLAAQFLERAQHPNGTIDLLETNFDSTPDTGFVMHGVCTAACLAKRAKRDELFAILVPFIKKAAGALSVGGIHTPNHRWVVSSALAQANEIIPDPRYVRRIDQWLAEGIDIDADGQYTERSTSVYNTVCDRAFTVMAAKLGRPELLEPVRRNLQAMMYLLHPDYEVVTEISRRQDRDLKASMGSYWFPLRYLAARDQNGQFLEIANRFTPSHASLSAFMEYPEIGGLLPEAKPVPSDFEKELKELGVIRFRRGETSATILKDDPTFFTLRHGAAVIESVRFATAFFGKGQLAAQKYTKSGKDWLLEQGLEAPYYQPLDPPRKVTPATWGSTRSQRRTSDVCHLQQRVMISETRTGFKLRIQASGTNGVPAALELHLREGTQLAGAEQSASGVAFLTNGQATVSNGNQRIRFGPGLRQHSYTNIRGALSKQPGVSVYLTGFTPFDHTVEFECETASL
jgi:hypothetical protein